MTRTSSASKALRGKIKPVPADAVCLICGISRPLENSHIIPKNRMYDFLAIDRKLFVDQDSEAVIPLCCNHHTLYEKFMLTPDEFQKIQHLVFATIAKLLEHMAAVQSKGTAVSPQFYNAISEFIISFRVYGKGNNT